MRALIAALAIMSLGSCASVARVAVKAVAGGAPSVSADLQAGKTNSKTVGSSKVSEQKIEGVQAERVEQSSGDNAVRAGEVQTVIVNQYPAWLIIAFAAALFLDSPLRWPGQIMNGIRTSKRKEKLHANL